jgi:hypothetical protein
MGGTFGVAIYGTILNNRLSANLADLLPKGANGATGDLTSSPSSIKALPAAIKGPVIEAFVRSLDTVFLAAVPLVLIGFVLTFTIREIKLRGHADGGVPGAPSDARQEATDAAVIG